MSKWEMVRLGDIYEITSSKRVFQSEWTNKGVPFYRAREIARLSVYGFVDNDLFISEKMYEEYSKKYGKPQTNDIMITGVGTLGVCYVVKPNDRFYFKDGNIIWLRPKYTIHSQYIKWLFNTNLVKQQIARSSSGSTVGTYTISNAKDTIIPLPPFKIQKHISETLDCASEIISLNKKRLEELDNLIRATFENMFGDPRFDDKKFTLISLCEATKIITDGTHQSPKFTNEGIPFLFVSNIVNNEINYETVKFISKEEYKKLIKRTPIEKGDLLLTIVGSYGNPAIVKLDDPFCFQRHIAYIKPIAEKLDSIYLHSSFLSNFVKSQIEKRVRGVAQKTLNLSELKQINIMLAPIKLQNQFTAIVTKIEEQKTLVRQAIIESETLFNSLMNEYFD